MKAKKIVITGSAGTGKTSVIDFLKTKGFHCFEEVIRTLTSEAKNEVDASDHISNPIVFAKDPLDFNTRLLNGRIDQFNQAKSIDKKIYFFDRGIPDVLAYMDFFNQTYDEAFIKACNNYTYTNVFLLPPWKAIYKTDSGRFESFAEVIQIHEHLKTTYLKFGYHITEVPFGSIESRTDFILDHI
ncbi:ATP-binding protein [uncultured Algibacter sp.]|uniref:ATP-binding protein n=1 Tax=uncultured Algibacter sp. TaxID=298659 RepID=UPI0026291A0B|nr:ATP-binding protein [uncultured Algibacter sp.]